MGHGTYGMAAAARFYFNKPLNEISTAECALLAGILQVPGRFSPIRNPEAALTRRAYALRRMVDEGYLSQEKMEQALQEPLMPRGSEAREVAPYFPHRQRQRVGALRAYRRTTPWPQRTRPPQRHAGAMKRRLQPHF